MTIGRRPLIIDRPEVLTNLRRRTEWSLTAVGWAVWLLLCRPVLLLAFWLLGLRQIYMHMVSLGGFQAAVTFFKVYGWVILGVAVAMRVWNYYNIRKFRGRDRRRSVRETTPGEVERMFALPEGALIRIQSWREVAVELDSGGAVQFRCRASESATPSSEVVRGRVPVGRSVSQRAAAVN